MKSSHRRSLDFIIGLFVIFAIAGVVFIALRAAHITNISSENSYILHIEFDNIGGIVERAPVKSSGVIVGRVQKIEYDVVDYVARVEVMIENDFVFPEDSSFSVVSSNLLGGQFIAVDPGGDEVFLKNGDELVGNSAIVLEELIGKFLFDKAGEE